MCSVQKWTPRTGAPKLNHWDGGQNMFNNTVEADQLATIVFFKLTCCVDFNMFSCAVAWAMGGDAASYTILYTYRQIYIYTVYTVRIYE